MTEPNDRREPDLLMASRLLKGSLAAEPNRNQLANQHCYMSPKKRNMVIPLLGVLLGVLVAMVALVAMGMIYVGLSRHYYKPHAVKNGCIANLKQIHGATAAWAQENKKTNSDTPTPTDLYGATAYIREEPLCPERGKYVIGSAGQKPRCSIPGHTL